jgi:hypothetical protein
VSRVFEGGLVPFCLAFFPFDFFVVSASHAISFVFILCAGFRWAGSFGFEIGSRGLAAIFA